MGALIHGEAAARDRDLRERAAALPPGCVINNGYVKRRVDRRYFYEHRLVMGAALKRNLRSDEIVHHRDGDPLNNDLSNLELTTRKKHALEHIRAGDWSRGQAGARPDLVQPVRVTLWARCAQCKRWWARARANAVCCSVSCSNRHRAR